MEIAIIRHTTPDVDKGVCYGHADVLLKDTFAAEFQVMQQMLPRIDRGYGARKKNYQVSAYSIKMRTGISIIPIPPLPEEWISYSTHTISSK